MNLMPAAVTNRFGRSLLQLQKTSPKVMFYGGLVGVVGATVLACRATLKMSDVLADTEEVRDRIALQNVRYREALDAGITPEVTYDDKMYAKDLTVLKVKTTLNIGKLYAPSAGLMLLSVGALTGSHVTLSKRNASLTAAYATVDQAFEKYRKRVVEQLGAGADRDFRYGTREDEEVVEGKDGKTKTVVHKRVSTDSPSMYARFFDQLCPEWQRNPEYNRAFLQCQQNYMNERLKIKGHLFLNEVYDALGMERSSAGQIVGWVISKDGGDNFVDFGIFDDITNPNVRDFVNGLSDSILLDFNVDGVIYDKI
jgi:hypothetical protein